MITPAGIQSVADHGALYATIGQRLFSDRMDAELGLFRWDLDLPAARLRLSSVADPTAYRDVPAHLIASIAPVPRSILWGWAHPQAVEKGAAERLRALGEQHGIADLTTPEVPFTTTAEGDELGIALSNLGHAIAAAAVEATGMTPYYTVPSAGGSRLVFLIEGIEERAVDLAIDGAGITTALMGSVSQDHRAALLGFARHGGFLVREEGRTVELSDARGSRIAVTLDQQGRLANVSANLVPPAGGRAGQ